MKIRPLDGQMKGLIDMLPMRKFGNKEVVDWKAISKGFEFMLNETRCEVVSNEMVSKVSRNGRVRKERRLTVRVVGYEATIEVSATSFKAMSFGKRLSKVMGEAPKAKEESKIQTEFGWVTEEEYERIKASGRAKTQALKEEQEQQEREWREGFKEWKQNGELKREIDDIFFYAYGYKEGAKQYFERITNLDNFEDVVGYHRNVMCNEEGFFWIVYETPQELIDSMKDTMKRWEENKVTKSTKNWNLTEMVYLNEWRTELLAKYEAWVHEHWDAIWAITLKEIEELLKGAFGDLFQKQGNTNEFDNEFKECTDMKEVKRIYRRLSMQNHPDRGGSNEAMAMVNNAYERACKRFDRTVA